MIELKPNIYKKFTCPECMSSCIEITDIVFPGIHILADCTCNNCKLQFFSDFPVGHALFYRVSFNKNNLKIYSNENIDWFSKSLINSYVEKNNTPVIIQKKIYNKKDKVVLLNCIDYLYGHVLLKLFNAQEYLERYDDRGVIVLIPKQFEWLVPEGVSEVWTVDIKLKQARDWFVSVDKFIKNELKNFSTVYLSIAFSHPEFGKINIEKFTGTKPFDIRNFAKRTPTFTFIYREDRLWTSGRFTSFIGEAINQKPSLKLFKRFLVLRQNTKIVKTFRALKKILPNSVFNVVGLGTTGNYPVFINDLRTNNTDTDTEKNWCKVYSESHIVIGVHGSNMILPTALSAGFIEILPSSRENNFLQDIAKSFKDRMDVFLGRFSIEQVSPTELAAKAASIIKIFPKAYVRYHSSFLVHKLYEDINMWELDDK